MGTRPVPRRAVGRLGFAPQFSRSAEAVYEQITAQGQTAFDSVRLVIRGYPDTTVIVKDTTVFFDNSSTDLTLDLDVPVQTDGQKFSVGLSYQNGGRDNVVFSGSAVVQSHPADKPAPPGDQTITVNYAGPGATATRLTINPASLTLDGNSVTSLQLRAFDASNKE
ncbi:MAG TPA: hypothetical protein VHB25_02855, partial [Gemmatimonadaceae bacterium]|nr:hypothetical protein [Gemmatimonadaceae bacterium]